MDLLPNRMVERRKSLTRVSHFTGHFEKEIRQFGDQFVENKQNKSRRFVISIKQRIKVDYDRSTALAEHDRVFICKDTRWFQNIK